MNPIVAMMSKSTEDYVPEGTSLIKSVIQSRTGLIVPELIFKYGSKKRFIQKFPAILPWLIRSVSSRLKGYKSLSDNPAFPEKQADTAFIEELKRYALSLGCHDIGFTTLKEEQLFAGKTVLYRNVIVLSMPMNKKYMVKAPKIQAGREVWRIYDKLGSISNKVTDFIRKRGYGAQGGAALGGDSNYPLLARQAGMGWIGTNGLLISPETGCSQRLAVVYTSIENLPLFKGINEHKWIGDFCKKCRRCISTCPGKAIYDEQPILGDGGPKYIDHEKCAVPFSLTMGCSVCIKVCLFFSGDYRKIKKSFIR